MKTKRIVPGFQDAMAFLTVVPFPCPIVEANASQRLCRSMAWFPAAGGLIGAAGAAVISLSGAHWSIAVSAALGLAAMVVLTGGLHLDGWADTVDGLAGGRDPAETLRIMRDGRIGTMAAAGVMLLLGLKWALFQSLTTQQLLRALVTAGALSRWGLVLCARWFPYVPGQQGVGRLATDSKSFIPWWVATLTAVLIAAACWGPVRGAVALALAAATSAGISRFFLRRLGGITGDTMGAAGEMTELVLLLWAAAL